MDEYFKSFGNNLKAMRTEKKLTLAELSRQSGVGLTAISNYESLRVLPTLYNAKMIATALGVGLDDMLKEHVCQPK
jgi:transcriptional regulator with XRE-family HTH domain